MLGSGSAGNSALVATNHGKVLIDGGLSARQLVLRLEKCGVRPEQLDGVLLTHEHGDHIYGLEVLCRNLQVPIYTNALKAEAVRCDGALGFITDLGYATKMLVERLREAHTLVIETNHDEKLLQADPHRPWPVKQRIMSRHGHLSNNAAAVVISELLPGKGVS
jgi:phosphoribosyl 1,2-cyclic phosphodiesterase